MRILSCLVAALALLAGSNASAAVKVIYTVKGKVFEVTAFKNQKIFGRTGTDEAELPDGGSFSLELNGEDWKQDSRVLLTAPIDVRRRAFPDALEPHPDPFSVTLNIRNRHSWDDQGNDIVKHSDLVRTWNLHPTERTLAFAIWQSGEEPPQLLHEILPPVTFGWLNLPLTLKGKASQAQTKGRVGILLLGSDGFVAPRSEFADPDAQAALHCLVLDNEAGLENLLAKNPGIVRAKSYSKATLLHYAAQFDCVPAVAALRRFSAGLNAEDESADTPLAWAVKGGHDTIVEPLLAAGANPNAGLPLLAAIHHGQDQIAQTLLTAKADIEAENAEGQTPLMIAINQNRGAMMEYLLAHKAAYQFGKEHLNNLLCAKTSLGQTTIVRILLEHGAPPNSEVSGRTPLFIAAGQGNDLLVELLLKAGAKPDTLCKNDMTALLAAAGSGSLESVKLLLTAGANIAARNKEGLTVTHLAAGNGKLDVLAFLLEHGASPIEEDKIGESPLVVALITDNKAAALELYSRGARLDPHGQSFEAELEAVLRMDLVELLEPLVQSGWQADNLLQGDWPVPQVAVLFQAQRCVDLLARKSLIDHGRDVRLASIKTITQAPAVKTATPFYDPRPEELSPRSSDVEIEFIINAQGSVIFPRLTQVSDDRLRGPTLEAIKRFKYHAALVDAEPVSLQVRQSISWRRAASEQFNMSEVDEPPVPLKTPPPIYPFAAKRAGVTGFVRVEYIIDTEGHVSNIVALSSTHPLFFESVAQALTEWTFRPARKNGRLVNVRARQAFPFELSN